jgi:hypothetical protein
MSAFTESEQRFVDYLESRGYEWLYEPDYQEVLGLPTRLDVRPDFLVSRGDRRVICEVRQFEKGAIDRELEGAGFRSLSDKDVYGRARLALVEKAEQLKPLADCGLPLVIVLSNPVGAFVSLDSDDMVSVIFGNPKWTFPIDSKSGAQAGPTSLIAEDFGAFVSRQSHEGGERFVWRHPHISAVATLHERTNERDFIDQMIASHPRRDDSREAAALAAIAAVEEVNEAREAGRIPDGAYQWLDIFELDKGRYPLPRDFFAGPRDARYGFRSEEMYGLLDHPLMHHRDRQQPDAVRQETA